MACIHGRPQREPVDIWRAMTPDRKAQLVASICGGVHEAAVEGIKRRYPEAGPRERSPRLAILRLGDDLAAEAFPDARGLSRQPRLRVVKDANPWQIVAEVGRVRDALGVRYAVGGSLASGVTGEPRSTVDADLVVELAPEHVDPLIAQLSARFYVPVDRLRRAVRDCLSVNLIDTESGLKVDVFVAGGTPLDREARDRRVPFTPGTVAQTLYLITPEDVLLQKLRWYRKGGEVSDGRCVASSALCACKQGASTDRISLGERTCSASLICPTAFSLRNRASPCGSRRGRVGAVENTARTGTRTS